MASAYGNEAAPLLFEAAGRLQSFDIGLARRAYLTAWFAAIAANHLGRAGILDEISRAVRGLPPLPADPHPLDLALEAFALLNTEGYAVATPVLKRAANAAMQLPAADVLRWGWMVTGAAHATWDEDVITIYERQTQVARNAGALGGLPIPLQSLAQERAWLGDLSGAGRLSEESDSITAATGVEIPPYARVRILALQGREAEAAPLIDAVIERGMTRGQGSAVMLAHWSAAVLYNGLGRHAEAAAAAREVASKTNISYLSMWAQVELIEAAARVGDAEVAGEALDRLCSSTQPAGTDFALGIEARSRALLADGDNAERWFREAIERFARTRRRPELARSHLVYGEWLRGESRRRAAREQLRTAEKMFDEIGMEAFADRARSELTAAGAKQRQRPLKEREDLTPQELQIAGLARDGLTNAEIGAQLFLSARTVEWHLHKVFQKLGIDSRSGLHAGLGALEPDTTPA
jgi:DNA-binding CsgD family transcriptional regulator